MEEIIKSELFKAGDGELKICITKELLEDMEGNKADVYDVIVDGIEWCATINFIHATILYELLKRYYQGDVRLGRIKDLE